MDTRFTSLIASTHCAKSVVKSISRFQYIPGAIKGPEGLNTALALKSGIITTGGRWQDILNTIAQGTSVLVLIIGFVITVSLLARLAKGEKKPFPALYMLLALAYVICTGGALTVKMFF